MGEDYIMGNVNKIYLSIEDEVLGEELSPSNLTLPLLAEYVEQVQAFLRGSSKKNMGEIKASIEKGSLAIATDNSTGILNEAVDDYDSLMRSEMITDVDPIRSRIVELWQYNARKHPNRRYKLCIEDSVEKKEMSITADTNYTVAKEVWSQVELYLYGTVYDMGGKSKPNVHVELENGKSLKIESNAKQLTKDGENRLYTRQLIRVRAEQKFGTNELRNESLVSFEHYESVDDEEQYKKIAGMAKTAWADIGNPSNWVENLRGSSV
jgi:hypothetical protein